MLISKNLMEACADLTAFWSPKIVGEINDRLIKVAKVVGSKVARYGDHHGNMAFCCE